MVQKLQIKNNITNKKILLVVVSLVLLLSPLAVIAARPDGIPPVVNITSPADGAIVQGLVTITFTAEDQQGDLKEYGLKIDGTTVSTYSFSYEWDTTTFADGSHVIEAYAHDRTTVGTDQITVTVSNGEVIDDPPTVTITTPITGSTISGTQTISIDVSDDIDTLIPDIYIDGIYIATTNNYEWDTTSYSNDTHIIYAEVTDSSLQTASDQISVTVDNSGDIITQEVFKLMCFNIKESGESTDYPDWKEVVKEENADIIMFIETGYWDDNENEKLNQYVEEFNTYFSTYNPYEGYTTQDVSYSTSGAAIMSRYPVLSINQITHVPLNDGTNYDVTHDFLDVKVNIGGTAVHIIGAHLKAMTGSTNEQRREWEQEGIINYMDNLGDGIPIAYLGDLNSFSPEDYELNTLQSGLGYGPLSMFIDPYTNPETGEDFSQYSSVYHTFTDVFRTLNPSDLGITSPAYDSRIDFIYANEELTPYIINSTCGDTSSALTGSDHLTVDVFIALNSDGNDYISPKVTITNPDNNAIVSDVVEITFDAYDENGIDSQRILIDGIEVSTAISYLWDTTAYSEGSHIIRVEATDPSGNIGYAEHTVTVDNDGFIPGPNYIVINEFLAAPSTVYDDEWIELWNPLDTEVDISGCVLDDLIDGGGNPYTIPSGTIMAPNSFMLFYGTETGFALNNAGDDVNFIDTDGITILDSYTYASAKYDVSWGREFDGSENWIEFTEPTPGTSNGEQSGNTTPPAQVTGLSATTISTSQIDLVWDPNTESDLDYYNIYRDGIFLISVNSESYSDTGLAAETTYSYTVSAVDTSSNEGTKSTSVSATTEAGSTADPSRIVINEFLPDPYSLYNEEWIELYNPTSDDIDLSGCILDDITSGGTSPYVIPDGTIIAAGGFLVFYQSVTKIGLNNDGDTVNLIDKDGTTIIDSYSYSHSSDDVSYGRETDGSENWIEFTEPTPGASNNVTTTNGYIHVETITISHNSKGASGKHDIYIEVLVYDESGNPVSSVSVTIELQTPSGSILTQTVTTDSNGIAIATFTDVRETGTYVATVTDLSSTNYIYDETSNIETSKQYTI